MSKEKIDPENMKMTAAATLMLGLLVLPIAIGVLFGAGWGWLFLGLLLIAGAYRLAFIARAEKKKQEAESGRKLE